MKGFSLLELIIACALGLLLMAGIIESFAIVNRAMIHMHSVAVLMEKGGFVEQLIRADIQMSGFDACLQKRTKVTPMTNTQGVFTLLRYDEHAHSPCTSKIIRRQYFIKKSHGTHSLYRKENKHNAIELADGISDFQVVINSHTAVVEFTLHEKHYSLPWRIEEHSREFQ